MYIYIYIYMCVCVCVCVCVWRERERERERERILLIYICHLQLILPLQLLCTHNSKYSGKVERPPPSGQSVSSVPAVRRSVKLIECFILRCSLRSLANEKLTFKEDYSADIYCYDFCHICRSSTMQCT